MTSVMLVLTARDIIVNFAKCNYQKGKHSTPVIIYSLFKKNIFNLSSVLLTFLLMSH